MENAAIKIWNPDTNNRECSEIIFWNAAPNAWNVVKNNGECSNKNLECRSK
jgi:hypothetical protein